MKIGLDWDGTVNADPTTFREVVCSFLDAGHEVAVVTWRCKPESETGWERSEGVWPDIEAIFEDWGFRLPIYYCNGKAKRDFYQADIWIDDNPSSISFSLTRPPRFEENPLAYLEDEMICERQGHEPVQVKWALLRSKA
jgi:hypothetical protein